MANGIVKWFNERKGYGFIEQDEGKDLFVHHTSIDMPGFRTLSQGDRVMFDMEVGEGICTDMKAVRKDYFLDHDHSAYVDQWDWERVISPQERSVEFLTGVVEKIWKVDGIDAVWSAIQELDAMRSDFVYATDGAVVKLNSMTAQQEIGATNAFAYDVNAACSGWVYGLVNAHGLIAMGAEKVLVIGTDTLARITATRQQRQIRFVVHRVAGAVFFPI